jgi:hypothetical protein
MSAKTLNEKLNSGTIGAITSLSSTLITFVTFITVDAKNATQAITTMDSVKLTYILVSVIVGLTTYGMLLLLKLYVEKVMLESQKSVHDILVKHEIDIASLAQRHFISSLISFERLPFIYPDKVQGSRVVKTSEWVGNEMKLIRDNAISNRKKYNISLDAIEDEFERIYGDYYPYRSNVANEPDTDKRDISN